MRTTGTVRSERGLGPQDHLCWSFDDRADFVEHALGFLADGIALGQRIAYIGERPVEQLRDELSGLDDAAELLERGAASVASTSETYESGAVIGPEAQVAAYRAATDEAVAAGYRGLRVAADATAMVRTPRQLDGFAAYEHLIDRAMAAMPFAAMCGYDRPELGDETVGDLACLHPVIHDEAVPFQLLPVGHADLSLVGEVDTLAADVLARALERAACAGAGPRVVVDASRLDFIDHNAMLRLDDHARATGRIILLREAPSVAARLCQLLGVDHVEVAVRA